MTTDLSPQSFQLETDRLILRPFVMTDAVAFAEICANPNVMRYIGDGKPLDLATVSSRMADWIALYAQQNYGLLALTLKGTAQLIGFCGLLHQTVDGEAWIELGYRLDEQFWGKGIATEAAIAVKDYAFHQCNIPTLISIIHHENVNSKRVVEKLGMTLMKKTQFKDKLVDIFWIHNLHLNHGTSS